MRWNAPEPKPRKDLPMWISRTMWAWPWMAVAGRVPLGIFSGGLIWYQWSNNEWRHRGR